MLQAAKERPKQPPQGASYLFVNKGNGVYACIVDGRCVGHAKDAVEALRKLKFEAQRRKEYKRCRPCPTQLITKDGPFRYSLFQQSEFIGSFRSANDAADFAEIMLWYLKARKS